MKCSRTILTLVLGFASSACVLLKTDERVDVVVAATDLGAGTKITHKDITITSARGQRTYTRYATEKLPSGWTHDQGPHRQGTTDSALRCEMSYL
jgi:hypothetical protein